jgi:hypothetical protein
MKNNKVRNKLTLKERLIDDFCAILFIILIPLILVILLLYCIWNFICGFWLKLLVRKHWHPQGKNMLFVYSNSPNWKEYIEENILTKISGNAVIINWSERSKWDWTNKPLELRIFNHWTGVFRYIHTGSGRNKWDGREFNPIAITFVPWWRVKVVRFWQAFKDYKHGKDKKLKELENQLFEILKKAI